MEKSIFLIQYSVKATLPPPKRKRGGRGAKPLIINTYLSILTFIY